MVLPFFLLSPAGFFQGVITAQIGPRAHAIRVSPLYRLRDIAGFHWLYTWSEWATVVVALSVAGLIIGGIIVALLLTGLGPAALEWFMLAMAAGSVVMFMSPSQFLYHFTGFLGPFLAGSVALPLARCADGLLRWLPISERNWAQGLLTALAVPVISVFAALQVMALSGLSGYLVLSPAIQRLVPPGACLLSDTGPPLVMTNRLISSQSGCVTLLDSTGADLAFSHGLKPDTGAWRSPALRLVWARAFQHAQFVLLKYSENPRVAWTPSLKTYFRQHFTVIFRQGAAQGLNSQYYTLYRRRNLPKRLPRHSSARDF
jgi:hypothetical protein